MTPWQIYLENEAKKEEVKRNNVVNLTLLNVVMNLFAGKGQKTEVSFKDIFGELQLKDYDLLNEEDFETREEFIEYLKNEVQPLKEELGV